MLELWGDRTYYYIRECLIPRYSGDICYYIEAEAARARRVRHCISTYQLRNIKTQNITSHTLMPWDPRRYLSDSVSDRTNILA